MKRKTKSENLSAQEPVSSTEIEQERKSEEQRSTVWKRKKKGEMAFRRKRRWNKRRWVNKKDNFLNVTGIWMVTFGHSKLRVLFKR